MPKYNEFKIVTESDGKKMVIVEKKPTKRGHVMISKMDAEEMNTDHLKTKLLYELAEEKEVKPKGRPKAK